MNLLQALKTDHEEAKSVLQSVLDTEDAKERTERFKEFKAMMTAHSRSEEKVLYRRMEKSEEKAKNKALKGEVEHEIVDGLMSELSRGRAKDSERWTARCQVLQELIDHHVEEEESEFFALAKKLFDDETLEKMGEEFEAEKSRHHAPRHAA